MEQRVENETTIGVNFKTRTMMVLFVERFVIYPIG